MRGRILLGFRFIATTVSVYTLSMFAFANSENNPYRTLRYTHVVG